MLAVVIDTGWLRLVGSLKLLVSFAVCSLFYRAFLQKRPIILRSLLIVATPYLAIDLTGCCLGGDGGGVKGSARCLACTDIYISHINIYLMYITARGTCKVVGLNFERTNERMPPKVELLGDGARIER